MILKTFKRLIEKLSLMRLTNTTIQVFIINATRVMDLASISKRLKSGGI